MTPLMGGTHFPIRRNDNNFGIVAAKVPATNKGTIWPIAKLPRKIVPLIGFPCCATQARRTASTGVVQGDEANPKANPAETGANAGGDLFFQISGSGPVGNENLIIPRRLRPIIMASKLIKIEKKVGNWPYIFPKKLLRLPNITSDVTIPPQKLIVLCKGVWSFLNPAKYAIVIGKSDSEQGPKLVKRPPVKTIRSVRGFGLFSPLLINCSPWRVKSDKIKLIEEMFKKRFVTISFIPRLSS